jgi:multiple sugar transport system permease protein
MFIGGNFVPNQILMIPVRNLVVDIGAYDTVWALILFHTAFQIGFATLFLRNFIVSLPNELFEAARVEGATEFQILRKVAVPLVRPALAGLAVLIFTFVWNDYFWALVLVQSDSAKPMTLGLASLKGEWLTAWNLISAGALLAALPPVMMFFFMQKHFVAGLTAGAVRG